MQRSTISRRSVLLRVPFLAAGFASWARALPVIRNVSFHDDFSSGKLDAWQFPYPEDWEVLQEGSRHYLHMKRNREPGVPRRPLQFALIKNLNMAGFNFQTRVRREGRSMMIVFNYVDTLHFYYAHLSQDTGKIQPVHNGIFIVNGAPRVRIAGLNAPPALPDREWHTARLTRDTFSGSIKVFMDESRDPLFSVTDTTFLCGKLGLGSFDETGDFADVKLEAQDTGCVPGHGEATLRPAATH